MNDKFSFLWRYIDMSVSEEEILVTTEQFSKFYLKDVSFEKSNEEVVDLKIIHSSISVMKTFCLYIDLLNKLSKWPCSGTWFFWLFFRYLLQKQLEKFPYEFSIYSLWNISYCCYISLLITSVCFIEWKNYFLWLILSIRHYYKKNLIWVFFKNSGRNKDVAG